VFAHLKRHSALAPSVHVRSFECLFYTMVCNTLRLDSLLRCVCRIECPHQKDSCSLGLKTLPVELVFHILDCFLRIHLLHRFYIFHRVFAQMKRHSALAPSVHVRSLECLFHTTPCKFCLRTLPLRFFSLILGSFFQIHLSLRFRMLCRGKNCALSPVLHACMFVVPL